MNERQERLNCIVLDIDKFLRILRVNIDLFANIRFCHFIRRKVWFSPVEESFNNKMSMLNYSSTGKNQTFLRIKWQNRISSHKKVVQGYQTNWMSLSFYLHLGIFHASEGFCFKEKSSTASWQIEVQNLQMDYLSAQISSFSFEIKKTSR